MKFKFRFLNCKSFLSASVCQKIVAGIIIGGALIPHKGLACSAIATSNGPHIMMAANYDWKARGGIVFESPRGQVKQTARFEQEGLSAEWVSKYASLTVSQFGRDFPMQGINEAGLVGNVLVASADYPKQGPLGVITEVTWLQYQLDQFSTVGEVAAHVGDFGIEKVSAQLHWFLCDATGSCIIVEFIKGEPVVHQLDPGEIRAVTNSRFLESKAAWRQWQSSGTGTLPAGYNSFNRFIRLASRGALTEERELIGAIDDVALDGFTAFQAIFTSETKQIKVRIPSGRWQTVSFDHLPFDCKTDLSMMSIATGKWDRYSHAIVDELFTRASDGADDLTTERRQKILETTENVRCAAQIDQVSGD